MLLQVKPKNRPDSETLLKHPILRRKSGVSEEMEQNYPQEGENLLKTIKFNAYNMNSLKNNLPKSSYGPKDDTAEQPKMRKDSLDSLDYGRKERVLSACGVRRDRTGNDNIILGESPSYQRK